MIGKTGSDWIKANFRVELSPLGTAVANLLDDVFSGIYHLDSGKLKKVDWNDPYVVSVQLHWQTLATYDSDHLTRLVVLSHDRCLRLDISARTVKTLELMFHQRQRDGDYSKRMPTIEEHIASIRKTHPQP